MIKITNSEREALERVGLFRHKKTGYNGCDPSFYVANKEHTGRNKHTYIVEEPEVLRFLGRYDGLNLQRVNDKQMESLRNAGFVNEKNTQKWGEYVPNAVCFEGPFGEYRIVKMTAMMLHLGLWKDNKRKKMAKQNDMKVSMQDLNAEYAGVNGDVYEGNEGNGVIDINEQAKELGMPDFIIKDVDTGEVVMSGDMSMLNNLFGGGQANIV